MTTTDPLDVLQAALDAATPGHLTAELIWWKLGSTRGQADGWWWDVVSDDPYGTVAMVPTDGDGKDDENAQAQAALIAAAVNLAPDLLAAIRNVRALAEAWKQSSPTGLSALAGAARELRAALGSFGGQQ